MCGRFQASRAPMEVPCWFKTAGPPPNSRERYNAAPTQSLLTVLRDPEDGPEIDGRRLEALR
jgi:putative SOS response-associated peptidase YedK